MYKLIVFLCLVYFTQSTLLETDKPVNKVLRKDLLLHQHLTNRVTTKLGDDQFSFECTVCQYGAVVVKDSLELGAVQDSLKKKLLKVCLDIPINFLNDTCSSFVNMYLSSAMDILSYKIHPGVVCKDLGLCPTNMSLGISVDLEDQNLDKCGVCKVFSEYFDKLLATEDVDIKMGQKLSNICDVFSDKYAKECQYALKIYFPYGMQILAQSLTAQEICLNLELC